jgi:hypothetical protein
MARKTLKPKKEWRVRKSPKHIEANYVSPESPEVGKIVGDAIKRMAVEPEAGDTTYAFGEAQKQHAWFDGPQGAGLHVLRTERGEKRDYQVVRAVFINDGLTQCYEMRWHNGGRIDMAEFTNPNFQKVNE